MDQGIEEASGEPGNGYAAEAGAEPLSDIAVADAVLEPPVEAIATTDAAEAATIVADTPLETPEQFRERIIRELESDVASAAVRRAHAKAEAKSANAAFDSATEELADFLSRPIEKMPLFDGKKEEAKEEAAEHTATASTDAQQPGVDEAATETLAASGPVASLDDSWKATTIEDLGLPAGLCTTLRETNGIATLGELADFSSSGKPLTDLDGIGQAKAEKIEAACEKFWAQRKV